MNKVMLVDDDSKILEFMSIALEDEGFKVYTANNGVEALKLLESTLVDIAIVDVMMPEMDGFELTSAIKSYLDIPILFVTARGTLQDKITGFNLGADDYIVKPFLIEELILRIQTLLKRYQINQKNKLIVGDLTIQIQERLIKKGNQIIDFPLKEFELIAYLAQYKNRVMTREELITKIWGYDYGGDERTVDVHIKRIREKLTQISSKVEIKTIRGVGYRLETT